MEVSMIKEMSDLLVGKDNEVDIKRYGRLIALYGLASVLNNVRAGVIIPSDDKPTSVNIYAIGFAGSGLSKSKSVRYMKD